MRGSNEWETNYEVYTPNQVEAILRDLHIEIVHEVGDEFLCYCPLHYNRDTPAFSISHKTGMYCCYNPGCEAAGNLEWLIFKLKGYDKYRAKRLIAKRGSETNMAYEERMARALAPPEPLKEFDAELIDKLKIALWDHDAPLDYMHGRGFKDETLHEFDIGYSSNMGMITIPLHDVNGMPLGLIGRSVEGKDFHNSSGLPKSKTMFNLHRAKHFETAVVTESATDAMRSHQAGYKNTAAINGGHLSSEQIYYLNRHFSTIVIMTDNDKAKFYSDCGKCKRLKRPKCFGHSPGRELGAQISMALRDKRIMWASYEEGIVYPRGAKDAGEMTDEEIRQCLMNAVSDFEYQSWQLQ